LIAACNICDERIQELVLDGVQLDLSISAPNPASVVCGNDGCRSRPRTRSFRVLFDEHVAHRLADEPPGLVAMEVEGVAASRRLLKRHFGTVLDAGAAGRPCVTDLRTFESIEDASIHLLVIPQALERIVELDDVFEAASRVLALNGLLAFHIDAARVRGGDKAPVLPTPGGRITVGLLWLLSALASRDLEPAYLQYGDPLTRAPVPWFLARRLRRPGITPTA
jgi:hypothetical protein